MRHKLDQRNSWCSGGQCRLPHSKSPGVEPNTVGRTTPTRWNGPAALAPPPPRGRGRCLKQNRPFCFKRGVDAGAGPRRNKPLRTSRRPEISQRRERRRFIKVANHAEPETRLFCLVLGWLRISEVSAITPAACLHPSPPRPTWLMAQGSWSILGMCISAPWLRTAHPAQRRLVLKTGATSSKSALIIVSCSGPISESSAVAHCRPASNS
jgi:hypothetical protein